jgi:competence protein ComEA
MTPLPESDTQSNLEVFWITYRIPLIVGAISIFVVVISLVLLVKSTQMTTPIQISRHDDVAGTASASLKTVVVDIEGAVLNPGIYSLPAGARVEDAIQAGGGLGKNADEDYIAKNINRAMKVADGMKIYVPTVNETSHNLDSNGGVSETSHNFMPLLRSPIGSPQNGGGISVNLASKDQLDSLPGVGPVTAQKIIDNRPYQTLEDLVVKKAIGPSLFEKLKNSLSL